MKFEQTTLPGVWIIELEPYDDERGFLARTYCEKEFAARGLNTHWPQCNLTHTRRHAMIRGLHYQAEPVPEVKLVRCTAGAVFDVVVDVRRDSQTFGRWQGFELTAANGRSLYIAAGFAHGFQSLADGSELFYMMGAAYVPELARGLRWNDTTVGIDWPLSDPVLSPRDLSLPLLSELR